MEETRDALFNFSRVCRFCLSKSSLMSPIFYCDEVPTPTVANKIMSFCRIQLIENDGLPAMLCYRCLYLAEKCFEFKSQCEASDSMLRKYVSMVQHTYTNQPSIDAEYPPKEASTIACQQGNVNSLVDQVPVKRKRGRPRKEENLIFYSSTPAHTDSKSNKSDLFKMMEGTSSATTVESEIVLNSDEEKKETIGSVEKEPFDSQTVKSLALARAKAKMYMGVVMSVDENGQKTRRHLCKNCGKTFGHCSDLRKHVLVHTGERPFHCQLCDKTFSRSTNLNKHLKVHSGQKPYSCTDCPKSFASKGDLQRHLVIHSGIKPFHCHLCDQCFSRKDKLTRHVKLHDDPSSVRVNSNGWTGHSVGVAECDNEMDAWNSNCEMSGDNDQDENSGGEMVNLEKESRDEEEENVESMIINIDPFSVDDDEKDATSQPGSEDQSELNTSEEQNDRIGLMHCPHCLQVFSNSSTLAAHILSHIAVKPHKCDICNKCFARRRELLRHETVHTGLKPYECPVCCKAFARKDKLARHKKIHEVVKPQALYCELCSVELFDEESLQKHMDFHHKCDNDVESEDDEPKTNGNVDSDDCYSDDET